MFRTSIRLASLVGALMVVTTAVALAAPGGNKPSSSINLVLTNAPTAGGTVSGPSYGDTVTFAVSTAETSQPFVHLKCFQNGTLVLQSWQAWFYGDRTFNLGPSPAWQSGAADCTAYLENWDSYSKNGRVSVLATTAFHVHA